MVPKTTANMDNETKMDGISFRPAFLFMASLIECMSSIRFKLREALLLYVSRDHRFSKRDLM